MLMDSKVYFSVMFDNSNVYNYLSMVTKYVYNKKTQIHWIINKTILLLCILYSNFRIDIILAPSNLKRNIYKTVAKIMSVVNVSEAVFLSINNVNIRIRMEIFDKSTDYGILVSVIDTQSKLNTTL